MVDGGVVVVGAGPAGAATALRLARAGIPVTLVERAKFPRQKVCGEYLGTGAVVALDELGLGERVRAQGAPLRGIRIVTGAAQVEMAFPRPALALARAQLDALIVDAACDVGARLIAGRVEDVLLDGGRVRGVAVRDASGERVPIPARFVIGADGIGSLVARKLNLTQPSPARPRFAVGGHYHGVGSDDGCIEMHCDGNAYLAINPLGGGLANVMAVVAKHHLETWSRMLDLAAALRSGPRVAIGPLAHRVRRVTVAGALLVGDAAGFLSPFTGQGVYLALRSAELAADALAHAYAQPRTEAAALAGYERMQRDELGARRRLCTLVDVLVAVPLLARRAARRLESTPGLAALLLDAITGTVPPQTALRPAIFRRLLA